MQITNKFLYKLGIDVSKTSQSKECDICHYCYFLGKGFKFQPNAWNLCHDVLMMSMNLSHIAISRINNNEAINLMQNIDLTEKSGTL